MAGVHKPMNGAPAYSRYVNRPLGRRLALLAFRLGWTPNAVTAVSGLCSLAGLLVLGLVAPTPVTAVLVTFLLALGYALDSADGQLARMTKSGSPRGEWLDHMVDAAKMGSIHLVVAVHLYRFGGTGDGVLLLPLAFSVVSTVLFFGMLLTDFLRRGLNLDAQRAGTTDSRWRSWIVLPTDYGLLCLLFLALAWTTVFLVLYAAVFVGTLALLGAALLRWWRLLAPAPRGDG